MLTKKKGIAKSAAFVKKIFSRRFKAALSETIFGN